MAALLELHEGGLGGLGHAGLVHDEVAAHVHDLGDVLDEDGALLLAGAAGDAVPDGVEADGVDEGLVGAAVDADVQDGDVQELVCLNEELLADAVLDLLG